MSMVILYVHLYRLTMNLLSTTADLVLQIGVIFMMFFAQNIGMLFAGEILCGLPWGAFQTLTTTYAADIAPPVLRPMLTTWNNACVSPPCQSGSALSQGRQITASDHLAKDIPCLVSSLLTVDGLSG